MIHHASSLSGLTLILLPLILATTSEAEAQFAVRSCRATGYFDFTYRQVNEGSGARQHAQRIDIRRSDMEVVASSPGQTSDTVTDAKRWACSEAALCFVNLATGREHCTSQLPLVLFETIKKPPRMESWRREVACGHARAGNVPGLRHSDTNTVILDQTKVVATGHRDGITRHADRTIDESDYVCWSPPPGGGPTRTDPDRPRPPADPDRPRPPADAHQPAIAPGAPPTVESIDVRVDPPTQQGKCPANVLMQATVKVRQPVEVLWWVTGEGGYESPKYKASLTKPVNRMPPWRRHIDPQPTARERMIQLQGGATRAPVHEGYFQLNLETVPKRGRALPLGESKKVAFTVDCNPAPPTRFRRPN